MRKSTSFHCSMHVFLFRQYIPITIQSVIWNPCNLIHVFRQYMEREHRTGVNTKHKTKKYFKPIPGGSNFESLDASIFLSDFCHLTLQRKSERLSPLLWPSVGVMKLFFTSGWMFPLLWLENTVLFSIISSMCVRLSHRKLHDGECLTRYVETSTGAIDGWELSLAAMQQLAPIFITRSQRPL